MPRIPIPPIERFLPKIKDTEETDCWLWQAAVDKDGYGKFHWDRQHRTVRAHQFAYRHFIGEVPEGLEIDHLCRVRHCVNPDHLEAVTSAENTHRGELHLVQGSKTHCPQRHPYSKHNTYVWTDQAGKKHRHCRACWKRAQLGVNGDRNGKSRSKEQSPR